MSLHASDQELIESHNMNMTWESSYYLRRRYFNRYEAMSQEGLVVVCQSASEIAKEILIKRFESNMGEASDETLVLIAQKPLKIATDILIERYIPHVQKMIKKMERKYYFRGFESNDLVQEGIIALFKSKDDYKIYRRTRFKDFSKHVIEKHMGTLMLKASNYKNKMLNESFSYHSPVGNDSEMTFEQMLKSNTYRPEETYINKETFESIYGKLTHLEKKVLKLYAKGLSYEEIGELVQKDKKAIDNTIQRIRKKGDPYKGTKKK
jgi:RNA polymerase sporulation-specific sigma factor